MQAQALDLLSPEHREKLGLLARDLGGRYEGVFKLVEEAFTEKESLAREKRRLDFSRRLLSRAAATLNASEILGEVFELVSSEHPVSELMAILGDAGGPFQIYLPPELDEIQSRARQAYLIGRAERLFRREIESFEVEIIAAPKSYHPPRLIEPGSAGRTLIARLDQAGAPLGLMAAFVQGKYDVKILKELRQDLSLLAPSLHNCLLHHRVKAMADRDPLTGLYNRRAFEERLRGEMMRHVRHALPLTLLMLDIDFFKKVNDTYGHPAGDEVLRVFSGLIAKGLRSSDFVARLGGEEFVLILPHTEIEQGLILAERIRDRVSQSEINYEGRVIRITASLGVAGATPLGLDLGEQLIASADAALYEAKNAGRNRVVLARPEPGGILNPSSLKLQ